MFYGLFSLLLDTPHHYSLPDRLGVIATAQQLINLGSLTPVQLVISCPGETGLLDQLNLLRICGPPQVSVLVSPPHLTIQPGLPHLLTQPGLPLLTVRPMLHLPTRPGLPHLLSHGRPVVGRLSQSSSSARPITSARFHSDSFLLCPFWYTCVSTQVLLICSPVFTSCFLQEG